MSEKQKDFTFEHPFHLHFCKQLWTLKDMKKMAKDYDVNKLLNTVIDEKYNILHVFFIGLRNNKCYGGKEAIYEYLKELMSLTDNKNFKDKDNNNYLHVIANYIREGSYIDNYERHSYQSDLRSLSVAYQFFSENYPHMNLEENSSKYLPGDYLLKKFKRPYESEHNTFKIVGFSDANYYAILNLYKVDNIRENLTVRSRMSLKDKLTHFDNLIDHCKKVSQMGNINAREDMQNLLGLLISVRERNNLNRMMENNNENFLDSTVEVKPKKVKI